jgi:hypothetical protein
MTKEDLEEWLSIHENENEDEDGSLRIRLTNVLETDPTS